MQQRDFELLRNYTRNRRVAKPLAQAQAKRNGHPTQWRAYIDREGNYTEEARLENQDPKLQSVLDEAVRIGLARRAGITPLEFLLSCLRDERLRFAFKLDAAKAAAPYMHKRMPIAVEVTGSAGGINLSEAALHRLTRAELLTLRTLLLKAGVGEPGFTGPDPAEFSAFSTPITDGTSNTESIRNDNTDTPALEYLPRNGSAPPDNPSPESIEISNANHSQVEDPIAEAAADAGDIGNPDKPLPTPNLEGQRDSPRPLPPPQETDTSPLVNPRPLLSHPSKIKNRARKRQMLKDQTLADVLLDDEDAAVPNVNSKHAPRGKPMTKSQAEKMLKRFEERRNARLQQATE